MNMVDACRDRPARPARKGARFARIFGWGALVMVALIFIAGIGARPVLWLGRVDFATLFAAGFLAALLLVLGCSIALGSWGGFIDAFLTPRARTRPVLVAGYQLFLCLTWGASTYLVADVFVRMTAAENASLDARFLSAHRSRNCGNAADFDTAFGAVNVCLPDGRHEIRARTSAPADLHAGEDVILMGRRNGYAFVVDSVMRRR